MKSSGLALVLPTSESILVAILVLIIAAVIWSLVESRVAKPFKNVIYGLAVLAVVLWLVRAFGLL